MPVPFLIGTESPRDLYLTDALAAVLPDVRIDEPADLAHEGMTTAPAQVVAAIVRFLLVESPGVKQPTPRSTRHVHLTATASSALGE